MGKMILKRALASILALALAAPAGAIPAPDPSSAVIGQMVARILENSHYNHKPLDAAVSKQLLMQYLEMYDYNHMFLTKEDVAEFEQRYGSSLTDKLKAGEVEPAYEIFDRFMQRLEQREAYVKKLTAQPFDFTKDESAVLDRHELPWPAAGRDSDELWRKRVKYEVLQEKLAKTKPEEVVKTVNQRYERLLRSYKELDASDVLQNYLTALTHTFDPHSDYMAAPQMENFNISMRLSLVGIGAVLRSEDGYAKIVSLVAGGPAETDKRLKPNDKIEAIAQGDGPWVDAIGMKLDRLVQLIRGEKGTTVRLRVIPNDALDPSTRVTISLIRDEIKLTDSEAKAKVIKTQGQGGKQIKVGVIDLPSFYADMKSVVDPKSTTRDVEKLLGALRKENVDGVIIDLRRNGGGSLSEAVALTGLFISEGPVVQIKDHRGSIKVLKDTDPGAIYAGPLVVLTSRSSASASEILAAALQDYGRAVIVGEKSTFGKGTVQSIIELAQYLPGALKSYRPGAVKLTIQKFYRISGGSTQNKGVVPDVHLPGMSDVMDVTETALKNALPYDEVEAAQFPKTESVTPAKIKELAKFSADRVASGQEFAWVREDVERYKKQKDDKAISLNEQKRLAEKKQDEDRATARKKARAARKAKQLEATEITLAHVDGTAKAAPEVAKSSTTAPLTTPADDDSYEKAPPTPDFVLEEGVRVLGDLIGSNVAGGARSGAQADASQASDVYIH
jgi:carboxyl-terminal processing protease